MSTLGLVGEATKRPISPVEAQVSCPFCLAAVGIRCRGGFGVNPEVHPARLANGTETGYHPPTGPRRSVDSGELAQPYVTPGRHPTCAACRKPIGDDEPSLGFVQGVVSRVIHQECAIGT